MAWDNNEKFINPYSFIPIDGVCKRKSPQRKEKLTGKIECILTTKTPIFIPNNENCINKLVDTITGTMKDNIKNFKSSNGQAREFFSYDGKNPIIPGSSLRGSIRSIYEAATNSCFSVVDGNEPIIKRSSLSGTPYLLRKTREGCYLCSAKVYPLYFKASKDEKVNNQIRQYIKNIDDFFYSFKNNKGVKFIDGTELYFKVGKYEVSKMVNNKEQMIKKEYVQSISDKYFEGAKKGFIYIGNNINTKRSVKIFELNENNDEIKLTEEEYERAEKAFKSYKKNQEDNKSVKRLEDGYNPVYYLEINNIKYISPSQVIKEVYENTVNSILDKSKHCKCTDINELCDACRLFGIDADNGRVDSKVIFTDAKLEGNNKNIYLSYMMLDELSSPRITSTEFYLSTRESKNLSYYNYDYGVTYKGNNMEIDYNYVPKISRKYYLNHENYGFKSLQEVNWNDMSSIKRSCIIKPVNKNVTFKFYVIFKGIEQSELDKLMSMLALGNNKNNDNCHKVGLGKPLGLGSINIKINKLSFREFKDSKYINSDISEGIKIKSLEQAFGKELASKLNAVISIRKDKNIQYPIAINKGKNLIFSWFVNNRGKVGKPKFNRSLPIITDKDLSLPSFKDSTSRSYDSGRKSRY